MQVAGLYHLRSLLGCDVVFRSCHTTSGFSPSGIAFVGAYVLDIATANFSAGLAYEGDFIEISTEWHQTALGDDYHQLCFDRVPEPFGAGARIAAPEAHQYPFEAFPHFHGDYFDAPVTRIEVFESAVTNTEMPSGAVEQIVYDSHVRFVAGARSVVLTTEHGSILGEIEIYAGPADAAATARGLETARLRLAMEL